MAKVFHQTFVVIICLLSTYVVAQYLMEQAYISVAHQTRDDKHSNETTSLLRSSNATNDPKKNGTYDPPSKTGAHKVGYNPGNYTSDTNRDEWTYNLENYTSHSFLHTVDNYFELMQQNRSFVPSFPNYHLSK
jgi:hypothetical protein